MTFKTSFDIIGIHEISQGEVSEGFKELVLKTSDTARYRGFESHLLRQFFLKAAAEREKIENNLYLEKYPRGRRGSPAKGVVRENRSEGSNPPFSARSS